MSPELNFETSAISSFCAEHHIARLALFGSAAKGALRPDSDVDVLVEFEPGQTPAIWAWPAWRACSPAWWVAGLWTCAHRRS